MGRETMDPSFSERDQDYLLVALNDSMKVRIDFPDLDEIDAHYRIWFLNSDSNCHTGISLEPSEYGKFLGALRRAIVMWQDRADEVSE